MTAATPDGGAPGRHGPVDEYLDGLFDQLAGTHATGRRLLADAEEHLRAAAAEGRAIGLSADEAERRAVQRFGPAGLLAEQVPVTAATRGTALRRTTVAAWLVTATALTWYGAAGVLTWLLGWWWVAVGPTDTLTPCHAALSRPDDCRELAHAHLFSPLWTQGPRDFVPALIAGATLLVVLGLLRRSTSLGGSRWTPSREAVTVGIAVPAGVAALYLLPVGVSGLLMRPVQAWSLAMLCSGLLAVLLCGATLYRWRHDRSRSTT